MSKAYGKARLVLCLVILLAANSSGAPPTRQEAEETARLLAILLDAGRVVIDHNQTLIDDPHKGNKGFTPEVFEQQLHHEFQSRTGIDLKHVNRDQLPAMARELLPALVRAGKEVVAEAQLVINQRGLGYKNFIPATFGSRAAFRFSSKSPVRLKQTTLLPRNEKNQPDSYEAAVLERLGKQPTQSLSLSELTEGGNTLRLLTPIYYTTDCLKCHGGPVGEFDISGEVVTRLDSVEKGTPSAANRPAPAPKAPVAPAAKPSPAASPNP